MVELALTNEVRKGPLLGTKILICNKDQFYSAFMLEAMSPSDCLESIRADREALKNAKDPLKIIRAVNALLIWLSEPKKEEINTTLNLAVDTLESVREQIQQRALDELNKSEQNFEETIEQQKKELKTAESVLVTLEKKLSQEELENVLTMLDTEIPFIPQDVRQQVSSGRQKNAQAYLHHRLQSLVHQYKEELAL